MKIPFFNRSKKEKMKVRVSGITDVGLKRHNNQDAFLALPALGSPTQDQALMVVADGMGGHASGEVASEMAIRCIQRDLSFEGKNFKISDADLDEYMIEVLENANTEIFTKGSNSNEGVMGTTCTAAFVSNENLYLAHVGDSRAYMFRNDKLSQITQDHSWVMDQVALGNLTEDQARSHPNRNIITQALGIQQSVDVQFKSISLNKNDTVVLCSDGLHGLVKDYDIQNVLAESNIKEALDNLLKLAILAGGHDNITVVLGEIF